MSIYFDVREDKNHNIAFVTDGMGNDIIRVPLLNKETAFSKEERDEFSLNGLLPPRILTMDQQIEKIHKRYIDLGKHLRSIILANNLTQKTMS